MNDRQAVIRKLERCKARYEKAVGTVEALEVERADLYTEARELDPPMTFRQIAGIFGVTEAAVMQKLRRRAEANGAPVDA